MREHWDAQTPAVSVVIATYNRADGVARLLTALAAQTLNRSMFEVIVVDDGSRDETAARLTAAENNRDIAIRAIAHQSNRGRAQARETGWRAARAPLVAFTDDDCVPDPAWLESGLAAANASPGAIVQGLTLPDPAGILGPFTRTVSVPDYDPAFQTCNVFYPRDLLERVGGFDVAAFGRVHGGEDSDLAWRAIKAGAAATFAADVRVEHAVNELGALGRIRVCAGWSLLAYARHPELRRAHFADPIFWKATHRWLAQALLGLALRRRSPLTLLLALPWLRSLRARGKLEGGGLGLTPFYAACDAAEIVAAIRSSARYGRLML